MDKICYEPIGVIHTPFDKPQGMPIQSLGAKNVSGSVEIFPQYADGIKDLEGFSHIVLIYYFHLSNSYDLQVVPFLDDVARGLFSTRAPRRPNPIGLSIVQLNRVQDTTLFISDIDMVDKTPLLDIKPYIPSLNPEGKIRIGWLERNFGRFPQKHADGRFVG